MIPSDKQHLSKLDPKWVKEVAAADVFSNRVNLAVSSSTELRSLWTAFVNFSKTLAATSQTVKAGKKLTPFGTRQADI